MWNEIRISQQDPYHIKDEFLANLTWPANLFDRSANLLDKILYLLIILATFRRLSRSEGVHQTNHILRRLEARH